uniref:Gamma-interferon-inducible lysosomal thiol reductase n=1 Tax=Timema monikensis TaxID=170555 RepID=A0A7R9HRQ8_9NEOP|nr:unnamed protein product [Timema monikensis]
MVGFYLVMVVLAAMTQRSTQVPLTVSVYYSTLCGDTIRFFREQFLPAWNQLEGQFSAQLVPYGKSTHSLMLDTWNFTCQFGDAECEGNKMHACAQLHLSGQQNLTVQFIGCTFNSSSPPTAGPGCAEQLGLNFSTIEHCMSSEDGNVMLASHGVSTHNNMAGLAFVPSILYNGERAYKLFLFLFKVFNESEQEETLSDFQTVLSRHVTVVQPDYCSQGPLLRSSLILMILSAILSLGTLILV